MANSTKELMAVEAAFPPRAPFIPLCLTVLLALSIKMCDHGRIVASWPIQSSDDLYQAQVIPIPREQGEAITHVAELPKHSPLHSYSRANLSEVRLGYKYRYHTMFWITIWTWDGQYVVYAGDRYHSLGTDEEQVATQAWLPASVVSKPFAYRFPAGVWLMIAIVLVTVLRLVWPLVWKSRAQKLLEDPRYVQALQMSAQYETWANVITYLTQQGVPQADAEQNMQYLIQWRQEQQQVQPNN